MNIFKKERPTEERSEPKVKRIVPKHLRGREFTWVALENNSREKSKDWYFILWTIALTSAAIAIILDNILFGILIMISAFIVSIYATKKPRLITFNVSRRGVRADTLLLPFSSLSLFAISEKQDPIYLILQSKKAFVPLYSFPISNEVNLEELREFLASFIDEEEIELPVYQQLMDRIGF